MNARDALAAVYTATVGYDPFEDDPAANAEAVLETLKEWATEARANGAGTATLDAALWQLERVDLDLDMPLSGPALDCITPATLR